MRQFEKNCIEKGQEEFLELRAIGIGAEDATGVGAGEGFAILLDGDLFYEFVVSFNFQFVWINQNSQKRIPPAAKTLRMAMDAYCTTMEDRKAWSMNLGHENLATTVGSYMPVNKQRQAELMRTLEAR